MRHHWWHVIVLASLFDYHCGAFLTPNSKCVPQILMAAQDDEDTTPADDDEAQRIQAFRERLIKSSAGSEKTAVPALSEREERKQRREEARRQRAEGGAALEGSSSPMSMDEFLSSTAKAAAAASLFPPTKEPDPWAEAAAVASVGTLLLGNPDVFCSPDCPKALLEAVGLAQPLPLGKLGGMRVADILPVLLVVGTDEEEEDAAGGGAEESPMGGFFGRGLGAGGRATGGAKGLLMNRRTGYLLADMEQNVEGFMIQPLNLGGREDTDKGLTMLHCYPEIAGTVALTPEEESGPLCFGGSFEEAQALVKRGTGSQFKFKFFVQSFRWGRGDLSKQVANGVWLPCKCGKEVVLKIREREGKMRPKPLWTEALELCGGDYAKIAKTLLENEEEE